jgi:hypothetical protein
VKVTVLVVLLASLAGAGPAQAQDPGEGLRNAEAGVASAEAEIAAAEARLAPAEARYLARSRRAAPARRAARSARLRAEGLKEDGVNRQRAAAARIARIEADHQAEVKSHDDQVKSGIGLALAALLAAAIALGWGRFKATAAVLWLTELQPGQALALCVIGGLALLVIGAAISDGGGLVALVGAFLLFAGFVLPTALLLARHSVRIQRGQAKPLLGRGRMPSWVPRSVAVVMGLLALIGFGSAISADGPQPALVSAQLRDRASSPRDDPASRRLAATEAEAVKLQGMASRLGAEQQVACRDLSQARRQLDGAEHRFARAESSARHFSRRLAAISARESREVEAQARRAERQAELESEETEEALSAECDPNYSGCLNPSSPDYDCEGGSGDGPDYTGTVSVLGEDHYGLDDDGDGTGCDP